VSARSLEEALADALGSRVARRRPVSGGDVASAEEILFEDGRSAFVKTRQGAPHRMFEGEAEGLSFLAEAGALRTPRVLAVGHEGDPAFLALELVVPGRVDAKFDEALGRGLAALHRFGAPTFGLARDNFLATLEQDNHAEATWAAFYRRRRLEPLVARVSSRLSRRARELFDRLFTRMEELCASSEPPSRLHGDLWSGNVISDERGGPCLVDPAVYGGHREIDLAMMQLFGGFSRRVFDAYREAWPLAPGSERRVALYQLYPLLVHVHLFGGSYVSSVEHALASTLG
jgi:fructosamine-3-kinase